MSSFFTVIGGLILVCCGVFLGLTKSKGPLGFMDATTAFIAICGGAVMLYFAFRHWWNDSWFAIKRLNKKRALK